ncbi:MAG: CHASE3 domain-containing protein, partial [Stellaceae bacterium]
MEINRPQPKAIIDRPNSTTEPAAHTIYSSSRRKQGINHALTVGISAPARPHGCERPCFMSVETWADDNSAAATGSQNRRRQQWTRMLPAVIIGLIAVMGISMGLDVVFDRVQAPKSANIQSKIEQLSLVRAALIDTEDGVRGYVMSGRPEYLENYLAGTTALASVSPALLAKIDAYDSADTGAGGGSPSVSGDIATLRKTWDSAVRQAGDNQRNSAEMSLLSPYTREAMDRLRSHTAHYIEHLRAQGVEIANWSDLEQTLLQILNAGGAIFVIIAMIYAFRSITRAITTGFAAKQQVEQLFSMADMLQSAAGQEDTNEVLRNTAANLLPRLSGALYVFNNSRDRLDLSMRWGHLTEAAAD